MRFSMSSKKIPYSNIKYSYTFLKLLTLVQIKTNPHLIPTDVSFIRVLYKTNDKKISGVHSTG